MNWSFLVALRNDANQLLVLEDKDTALPVFPWGPLEATPQLKAVSQKVQQDTGLHIGGLHLTSVGRPRKGVEVHRFTAYVSGGKLFAPSSAPFRSASWIAPTLIPKLQGASEDMVALVSDLSWTYITPSAG